MTDWFVTGATGAFGKEFILKTIKNYGVNLYCLVRNPETAKAELEKYFLDLTDCNWQDRIVWCEGDLERDNLGLSKFNCQIITDNCTAIINIACRVSWLESLDELENANVKALKRLHKLFSSKINVPLHQISSLRILSNAHSSTACITENDPLTMCPDSDGYSASKYMAELEAQIIAKQGRPVQVYRYGALIRNSIYHSCQLELPKQRFDILETIIYFSSATGAIPKLDGYLYAVPMYWAAESLAFFVSTYTPETNWRVRHLIPSYSAIKIDDLSLNLNDQMQYYSYQIWQQKLRDFVTKNNDPTEQLRYTLLTEINEQALVLPAISGDHTMNYLKENGKDDLTVLDKGLLTVIKDISVNAKCYSFSVGY